MKVCHFPCTHPWHMSDKKVLQRIKEGEIVIGEEVVESSYRNYSVDFETNQVRENTVNSSARRIPLVRIRVLEKHESLGIIVIPTFKISPLRKLIASLETLAFCTVSVTSYNCLRRCAALDI